MGKQSQDGMEEKTEELGNGGYGGENKKSDDNQYESSGSTPLETEKQTQNQFNQAIDELGKDSNAINDIIEEKRKAELGIAEAAKKFHFELLGDIKVDLQNRQNNVHQFKDNKKAIAILESDQKKIEAIQGYITTFRENVAEGVNYKRDKKTDKAQYNELLMTSSRPNRQDEITTTIKNEGVVDKESVHSLEQLEARSKQIDVMHKTWKELSQMKNDTDRSFGYRKLSDNLASMAMTGINTARQGIAFARALLTYAVVDVLYTGLLKGAGEGLMEGAASGYNSTNQGVKAAANAMYQLTHNAEKPLLQQRKELFSQVCEEYNKLVTTENKLVKLKPNDMKIAKTDDGFMAEMVLFARNSTYPDLKNEQSNEKTVVEEYFTPQTEFSDEQKNGQQMIEQNIDKAMKSNGLLEQLKKNDTDIEELREKIASPKPSFTTKGAAVAAGVVGAVVGGIGKAIWGGVKNPALALTRDASGLVKKQYKNSKPNEGTSWNKKYSQVQDERIKEQTANTNEKYAKNTYRIKFTEMEQERKAAAKKAKSERSK